MGSIPDQPSRVTHAGLLGLTCAVAAVTFAISFHGLDGYGVRVMHLGDMSPLVPVGVDLASLVSLLAAHMRRAERWLRRAYAWTVFATTAALSVAGNLADGAARGLAPVGLAGVAMAPVVFVLISHLAITSWRPVSGRIPDTDPPANPTPDPEPARPAETAVATPAVVPETLTGTAKQLAKIRRANPTWSQARVAERLKISERTVSRYWQATAPPPQVDTSSNGHHPSPVGAP